MFLTDYTTKQDKQKTKQNKTQPNKMSQDCLNCRDLSSNWKPHFSSSGWPIIQGYCIYNAPDNICHHLIHLNAGLAMVTQWTKEEQWSE